MTPPITELVQRLRYWEKEPCLPGPAASCKEAADLLEQQSTRITTLEQTLREIANADTAEWDDRSEFEGWAKGRARGALGTPSQSTGENKP
jgi:hypothetical protein